MKPVKQARPIKPASPKGSVNGGRRIQVRRSGVHGKGVFAIQPIEPGETLIEYVGEVISWQEALDRHPHDPAQPDHSEKAILFALLEGERRIGVRLTDSFAMWPGAAVCGLYLSHPESHYFGVGKIERDQVEDYASRKGWTIAEAERWLAPVLNYDPLAAARTAAE